MSKEEILALPRELLQFTLVHAYMARDEVVWDEWCPKLPWTRHQWETYEIRALSYYVRCPNTWQHAPVPKPAPLPDRLTLATPELEAFYEAHRSTYV